MKRLLAICLLALGNYSFSSNDQHSYVDLLAAVQNKDEARVQDLVAAGVNVNLHRFDNDKKQEVVLKTALQRAVELGDIRMVELLLKLGAKPDIYHAGVSPLRLAIRLSDSDISTKHQIIKTLAQAGAKVNALETVKQFLDRNGDPVMVPILNTPLHEAVLQDSSNVALLLELGADPTKVDNGGISPMRLVFKSCYTPNISEKTKTLLQPFQVTGWRGFFQ